MKSMNKDRIDEFLELLVDLQAVEVMGLARVLGINPMKEESTKENPVTREAQEILEDMIMKFGLINRSAQRELLSIMRHSVKYNKKNGLTNKQLEKGDTNGTATQN